MRRCLYFLALLLLVCVAPDRVPGAIPPPRRDLAEVRAVLVKAPPPPTASTLRPLNVLLVANRKDHGAHEHDYPRWLARWKVLLGGAKAGTGPATMYGLTSHLPAGPKPGAPGVSVDTAAGWPSAVQLRRGRTSSSRSWAPAASGTRRSSAT
jgi:hypothetical protein